MKIDIHKNKTHLSNQDALATLRENGMSLEVEGEFDYHINKKGQVLADAESNIALKIEKWEKFFEKQKENVKNLFTSLNVHEYEEDSRYETITLITNKGRITIEGVTQIRCEGNIIFDQH